MARLRTHGRALRGLLHVSSGQGTVRVAWNPDQKTAQRDRHIAVEGGRGPHGLST
jgi:hypothetical protein